MPRSISRITVMLFTALATLLVGAMAAWACTNLATLNLSQSAVQPGANIGVTGSSFATAAKGGQEVLISWDAVNGPVLAKAMPDPTGNIATSIAIPADAQPGYHVLIATQNSVDQKKGTISAAYGTPARAAVLIGAAAPADAAQPAAAPAAVAADASSTGMLILTVLLALMGIGLFGAGLGLFVRETRRRGVPAPVRRDEQA